MTMTAYWQRVNAERMKAQGPDVRKVAAELLKELQAIQNALYWALDPDDDHAQWTSSLIEHAHAMIDLGYDYKYALKANPPPKEEVDEDDYADDSIDKDANQD
jgi:hypothetical protein